MKFLVFLYREKANIPENVPAKIKKAFKVVFGYHLKKFDQSHSIELKGDTWHAHLLFPLRQDFHTFHYLKTLVSITSKIPSQIGT